MAVAETSSSIIASAQGPRGKKRWRILQNRIERARELRRAGNHAEQAVWELLCTHPSGGLRFQRQHPIGPYQAPFACLARKLVIDIDDDGDPGRRRLMEQLGWRVVRLAASNVLDNPDGTWREIDRLLNGGS